MAINHLKSNIKFLRKNIKVSQQEISSIIGVQRSTYSSWEQGQSEPRIRELSSLSLAFGTSIDTLIKINLSDVNSKSEINKISKSCLECKIKLNKVKSMLQSILEIEV